MSLLTKRAYDKDMTVSPPPQAKRAMAASTSDLLHNHVLMQVLQRSQLRGHGLPSTIEPVEPMNPATRLTSRLTSPREQTVVLSNAATLGMMPHQEILLPQARESLVPGAQMMMTLRTRSLPHLPFKGSPNPRVASQNPLDMLSSCSDHISNAPIKRQSRHNDVQPPKKKPHHEPQALKSCLKSQPRASKTDESYVGGCSSSGIRHGRGIMKYPNGCHYVGHFVSGKRHGYGKVWYPNDMGIYAGYWRDNKRHGAGTMNFANGDVDEGQWMNDEPNGFGKLVMKKNCESYTGDFVDWQKHGIGIHVGPSGDVYKGEYMRDVRHGSGVLTFANGVTEIRVYCQGRLLRHDFVR